MGLRSKSRNPWVVAPILAVVLSIGWASVAVALECPEVVVYRVGDKFGFIGWTMHENEYEIDDFGGYRLWMREAWKGDEFSLVREYVLGQDIEDAINNWDFPEWYDEDIVTVVTEEGEVLEYEGVRRDSADFFQNAFPYQFSVTAFAASDPQAVNAECREANTTEVLYPRVGTRGDLEAIQCIPNPYRAAADWEYGGQRRVAFIGLPAVAKIRIYTVSASHVKTLDHEDAESDLTYWDLTNDDGQEVAPGVYLWSIDAETITGESLGSTTGKIMIIK